MSLHKEILNEILNELCVRIGERPTGSENNHKTQEYIGHLFEQDGYVVESQNFDCLDWSAREINLRLGARPLPASVSPYSLPCDVTAPMVLLEDISQLEQSDLRGKIAVLHGDLTTEPLMPKNFRFWNSEEHRHIIRVLEEKGPAATLTVSFSDNLPTPIIEDGDFNIPCAVISKLAAQPLFDGTSSTLTLKIDATRRATQSANVIARSPGKSGQKRMVLSAHMDTKPGTPGALDNASGIAILLMVGRLLRERRQELALEFVCFNGEDYYSNAGEVAYLDRYKHEFGNILFNVNCDGVGLKDSRIGFSYMGCPASLVSSWEQARAGDELFEVIDPWPQGDHMLFVMHGVPSMAVTSTDIFPLVDEVIHTEKDTMDLLDVDSIYRVSEFLAKVCVNSVQ